MNSRNLSRMLCLALFLGSACAAVGCTCWTPTVGWQQQSFGHGLLFGRRSLAIPDTYPVGSVVRAHYQAMETNGEAADFIMYDHEFVKSSAELTPAGKDHVLEIAARMRSVPFPVLVERSENNSDPELDQFRRGLIAQILADFGNPDADQRTIVAPAYGRGTDSMEAQFDYYRFLYTRGLGGGFGQFGGGGFGAGGGGGGGIGFAP